MGHGIRGRLILIITGVAVCPVLMLGAALAWLSHRTGTPLPLPTILAVTGIAAAAAAGIAAASALWIAGRLIQSLQAMTEAAEAIVAGDLTPRAPAVSDDEIGILAGTFNHMARKLRDRIGTLEHRAAERTKALAVFRDISRISTLPDERRLAAEAAERVKNAFNYHHVQIFFLDAAGGNLILAGGTGKAGQTLADEGYTLSKGEGPAGRAAESNTVVLVGDTARDGGGPPNPLLPKVKSEIAIPIAAGDELLGVLDVQQNFAGGVTRADAELLQPIADQVAVSVRSARLLARVWQQAERKDLIASIGRNIGQTTAVEDALRVTARELGRVLGSGETRVVLFELPPAEIAKSESGPGDDK
jgi:nitrate/nitrite-specific signal transduction histidine kinase